jgi:16S rRNA (adenine1518-N6/adenine1519-N6)-dimethyltransferase
MKLSEMRDLLVREGIQLTKSLGQNFLHDGNQLRRIADAAELTKSDQVLEIGPGLGPLTMVLAQSAGEVLAIEKDERLVRLLRTRLESGVPAGSAKAGTSNVRLVHDDALELLKREARDWMAWKLVSNLPYSVASPILVELALGDHPPERLVATLQLEVARRLMAKTGDDDYGVLSLLVQLQFEPRGWFKIPPGCFFPEPDVDSACVCLVRRARPLLLPGERAKFVKVVKRAFSQRRKMMMKLLRQDWPENKLLAAYEAMKLSPGVRAEAVSLENFAGFTRLL